MRGGLVIAVLASGAIGCAATMVSRPAGPGNPYAPVNDAQRGGVVKYLNAGASFVVNARRNSAYKKMFEACAGKYRIDGEGDMVDGMVTWTQARSQTNAAATVEGSATTTYTPTSATTTGSANAQGSATTTTTGTSATAAIHYWVMKFSCVTGDTAAAKSAQ